MRLDRGMLVQHASNVPRWGRQPGARVRRNSAFCLGCRAAMEEEDVDDGACAGDVRAERAEGAKFVGERRRSEIVRRKRGKVTRTADALKSVDQGRASLREAFRPVAFVEPPVDVS